MMSSCRHVIWAKNTAILQCVTNICHIGTSSSSASRSAYQSDIGPSKPHIWQTSGVGEPHRRLSSPAKRFAHSSHHSRHSGPWQGFLLIFSSLSPLAGQTPVSIYVLRFGTRLILSALFVEDAGIIAYFTDRKRKADILRYPLKAFRL